MDHLRQPVVGMGMAGALLAANLISASARELPAPAQPLFPDYGECSKLRKEYATLVQDALQQYIECTKNVKSLTELRVPPIHYDRYYRQAGPCCSATFQNPGTCRVRNECADLRERTECLQRARREQTQLCTERAARYAQFSQEKREALRDFAARLDRMVSSQEQLPEDFARSTALISGASDEEITDSVLDMIKEKILDIFKDSPDFEQVTTAPVLPGWVSFSLLVAKVVIQPSTTTAGGHKYLDSDPQAFYEVYRAAQDRLRHRRELREAFDREAVEQGYQSFSDYVARTNLEARIRSALERQGPVLVRP